MNDPQADKMICFCFSVKKSTIQAAIEAGCQTVQDVQARTRACSGCQSCRMDIEALSNAHTNA